MNKKRVKNIIFLNLLLLLFSLGGVCSKYAAGEEVLSDRFIFFYGGVLMILGIYAICWQQLIKQLPLTLAYANKAVTLLWGMIWGIVFFSEEISVKKIIGVAITLSGVLVYTISDREKEK